MLTLISDNHIPSQYMQTRVKYVQADLTFSPNPIDRCLDGSPQTYYPSRCLHLLVNHLSPRISATDLLARICLDTRYMIILYPLSPWRPETSHLRHSFSACCVLYGGNNFTLVRSDYRSGRRHRILLGHECQCERFLLWRERPSSRILFGCEMTRFTLEVWRYACT
jgi:hypothetical protein